MSVSMKYQQQGTLLGKQFPRNLTKTAEAGYLREVTLAAAKTGNLTTRTDNDTGELTMDVGHGITTGARISIFWVNADGTVGSRRGVIVGTVSVNAVPFGAVTAGAGDNLPADEYEVTVMVENEEVCTLTGSNVVGFAVYSEAPGNIVFANSSDAEVFGAQLLQTPDGYSWASGNNITNPLAGGAITKIFFAHADSTQSRTMRAAAIYD